MAPLIPSAENGLFSRQVFYYMPGVKEFISQFQSNDRELVSHFKRLGAYYSRYHRLLMASGNYQLKLRGAQQEEFNRVFDELFKRSVRVNDAEMNSSVVRLAINCLRMILITALLRATEPTFRHTARGVHHGASQGLGRRAGLDRETRGALDIQLARQGPPSGHGRARRISKTGD